MRIVLTVAWVLLSMSSMACLSLADAPSQTESAKDAQNPEQIEWFEKRVRPILAANCYSCHSDKKQEGNLRLDSRPSIIKGGDSGPAAVTGDLNGSLLIAAVRQSGDLKMPPEGKLQASEVAALERWVTNGLAWPSNPRGDNLNSAAQAHWAFQPIRSPAIPVVPRNPTAQITSEDRYEWEHNPIDRFVRFGLAKAKLAPSPTVDRSQLARRFAFDLIGLPPTPAEIQQFTDDQQPDATERAIDRWLASPQFGERWGRHWLDVARYADNKGYVFFEEKSYPWAYTYRDYVIRALNSDVPYDRFVTEQLAADQLDLGDDQRPLTALAFLTIGGHFMNNTHDIMDDRIDVVTRGLMGLTVTCCRCHDHKYDPLTQADYYALYGVFRSCVEPTVPPMFEPPTQTDEYQKFATELASREQKLVDFVSQKHAELVSGGKTRVAEYLMAANARRGQPPADNFMLLVDKGDINPTMLLRWQTYIEAPQRTADPVWSVWSSLAELGEADFSTSAAARIQTMTSGTASINPLVRGLLEPVPTSLKELADRYSQLLNRIDQQWTESAKQAKAEGREPPSGLSDPASEELRQVFYGEDAPPDVPLSMDWGFLSLFPDRPTQAEYQKLLKELEQWMMTGAGAPPRAMVLRDVPRPFSPRIFLRGNPNRLGDTVPRRFLKFVDEGVGQFQKGSGRLELARAIVSPKNPLTSRSIVNRIWMHHFGVGLVPSPGDFGLRSEPPSHPELLDWLASDLMGETSSWSMKRLHRQILTSASYQQSSHANVDGLREDPANRLLWRMNRRRLDFESMRDSMVALSGELNNQIGGTPVSLLEGWTPRRTIYGSIDRMDTPAILSTFDFPSPAFSNPQRGSTTVTPQALYALNNQFLVDAAVRTLRRPEVATITDRDARLAALYWLCYGRNATTAEVEIAKQFLGDSPNDDRWVNLVHGLLMSNEFLFVD